MTAVLRSEWTKLRTLRSTAWCLLATVGLIVVLAVLQASGSTVASRADAEPADRFQFVHQPVAGDVTVVAHVRAQDASHPWAKAGIIIKAGAAYAAVMVTPGHGVRMRTGTTTDLAGSRTPAPRWLKLARTGTTVTGFESSDGTSWQAVGAVPLDGLPPAAEVGLFVTSPNEERVSGTPTVKRQQSIHTVGRATFDAVTSTRKPAAEWSSGDVTPPAEPEPPGPGRKRAPGPPPGSTVRAGDVFTLTGSGELGRPAAVDDSTRVDTVLGAVVLGTILVVTAGTLFITTEYRRNLSWTTFAATPQRGRVLLAKAVVLGSVTFSAGLLATGTAFWLSQPILRGRGYRPPDFPDPSAGTVGHAVVGSAAFLALVALFSLGVGVLLRRTAGVITGVFGLVFGPQIVAPFLPPTAGSRLLSLTPIAGMSVGYPWTGVAVLAGYAAAALGAGYWLLRRRDA
jgi:hypothetical protein